MPSLLKSPRAAVMAVFAAFGATVGGFAGSTPQMMAQAGLDNATFGFAVTAMTIAGVTSMSMAGALARRFSHRFLLLALPPAMLALLALTLTAGSMALFFVAITLYGLAMGATDVIMNAEAGAIEVDMKRPVYTGFHGSVSLSVAVFAILSSLLSTRYGTLATMVPVAIAMLLAMIWVWIAVPARPLPLAEGARSGFGGFTRPLVLTGVAAGLIIASEITALFWSSKLLAETAPQFAAIAGLGASFFGLTNALVRFPGDALRARFGEFRLMGATLSVAILGFVGLGFSNGFAANVFFFALIGMGLAVLPPCLFALAARQTPHNRAAGLSVAMLVAGAPRIVAPTLFGAIAASTSTRIAFGLCALMLLGAYFTIRKLARS
ncbi:MAG: hypothetical protein IPL47_12520 [Phyllobacteriaceae bacterium]|nr:hypothetical protein [Phyllobacteriaceae bacterium]